LTFLAASLEHPARQREKKIPPEPGRGDICVWRKDTRKRGKTLDCEVLRKLVGVLARRRNPHPP